MTDTRMSHEIQSNDSGKAEFRIRIANSFSEIDAKKWSGLTGTSASSHEDTYYNPFVSHAYLSALEETGCATAQSGWLGQHLLLETESGELHGAMPAYVKNHSQGEYVFDHGWADAFERAGGHYYPKLQSSIPFTPATGPRLLAGIGRNRSYVQAALTEGLKALTDRHGLSSAHATFVPDDEIAVFADHEYLCRKDQQFHFINPQYQSYDAFLATLASRKRKALKKERRVALENNIAVEWLTGDDLTEEIWDIFFGFYQDTGSRKWGRPYLTRAFFSRVGETMANDILLILAKRDGHYIAGAINFIGSDTLYGRHWGCVEDHPFLHFEICYHQAIDFAISRGLGVVEAGAQGEHKLSRGYLPVTTHSAHYITHPGLREAIADYLVHERQDVENMGDILRQHGPFKKA